MGVSYLNGNANTPCIVIGDDPSNEDNILVSILPPATSVHKGTVSDTEGTTPYTVVPNADLGSQVVETGVGNGEETKPEDESQEESDDEES